MFKLISIPQNGLVNLKLAIIKIDKTKSTTGKIKGGTPMKYNKGIKSPLIVMGKPTYFSRGNVLNLAKRKIPADKNII